MTRVAVILGVMAAAPVTVLCLLATGFDPAAYEASRAMIHRDGGIVGSAACRSCHPDQHRTWEATFHRTMTQRPTAATVLGAFDGREVRHGGRAGRVRRDGARFLMDVPVDGGGTREAEVALAVGSRRYQQYFERERRDGGEALLRLPFVWHVATERWLHVNTIFLDPDGLAWDAHRALWNVNCIFCHNTAPRPSFLDFDEHPPSGARAFESEVGELGIACESCHGPGAEHVAASRDPLARYARHVAGRGDGRIVDPGRLSQDRRLAVCGQCHGQRTLRSDADLKRWLTEGPTFTSGERLADHVEPVAIETRSPDPASPDLFRQRFWRDGTPRLTAYEYQGIVASPCVRRGPMTCGSCHTMHGGDPRGMLPDGMRGDRACVQCHDGIGRDVEAHTHHAPESSGSRCLDCHMPRVVYGILDIHRSHRIEIPDAARDAAAGRPHACTLCHVDQSLAWAAEQTSRLWGRAAEAPRARRDGAAIGEADGIASLHAGDAVQRAVYAAALGRRGVAVPAETKAALAVHLAAACGDGYPSVRWLARRSLLALGAGLGPGLAGALETWDHGDPSTRAALVAKLFDTIAREAAARFGAPPPGLLVGPDFRPDFARLRPLLDLQSDKVISIGE